MLARCRAPMSFLESSSKVRLGPHDVETMESLVQRGAMPSSSWIVKHAGLHRVAPQVFVSLSLVQGHGVGMVRLIQEDLLNTYEEYIHGDLTHRLLQEQTRLAKRFLADRIDALFIKGCALEALSIYPAGSHRVMKDIDILVPDWRTAWNAMSILAEWGYTILNTVALRPSQANQRLLNGTLEAARYEGSTRIKISVVVSPFMITITEDLHIDLWQDAIEVASEGVTFRIPSIEHTLLLLIAHGLQDGFIRLRDVNDFAMLLEKGGRELDWYLVERHLKRNGLVCQLLRLLRWLDRLYPCWSEKVPELSRLRPTWRQEIVPRVLGTRIRSVWRQVCYQLVLLIARKAGILRIVRAMREFASFSIYWKCGNLATFIDRIENLGRRKTPSWLRRSGFSFWLPLLLTPVAAFDVNVVRCLDKFGRVVRRDEDGILLLERTGRTLAITPCGFFMPTHSAYYDETEKEEATDMAGRLCELISREGGERHEGQFHVQETTQAAEAEEVG